MRDYDEGLLDDFEDSEDFDFDEESYDEDAYYVEDDFDDFEDDFDDFEDDDDYIDYEDDFEDCEFEDVGEDDYYNEDGTHYYDFVEIEGYDNLLGIPIVQNSSSEEYDENDFIM